MRRKKIATSAIALTLAISTIGTSAYARSSKRAAWNDASSDQSVEAAVRDLCYVEDGSESDEHQVASNVYANSEDWNRYKESWKLTRNDYEKICLTPGENETKLKFAWYSKKEEVPKVKLMDASGAVINVFEGVQNVEEAENFVQDEQEIRLYPNKVTVEGLESNTSYKYQYFVDGDWSQTYDYKTKDSKTFSVLYVGDPQIGASTGQTTADGKTSNENGKEYYAMNDAYNWEHTLAQATKAYPDLSFVLSAGDQINQTNVSNDAEKVQQQIEYAGFLNPDVLRSLPIATTIGNHDSKSHNYKNHFNNPNDGTEATINSATSAGADYYFTYGDALFISINTNNYNCAAHEIAIREAIEKNTEAKWRIVMFHQDIYGSGYDHSDSDGMVLRTQLTPIIDQYDIDAVLQGHDHTYSRTYQISAEGVQTAYDSGNYRNDEAKYLEDNAKCYSYSQVEAGTVEVVNPEGAVYFEANSSTGSKYYQMIGTQQNYIAARSQSWRPTYSVLSFDEDSLTVKTYDAATNTELVADGNVATAYTIVKKDIENDKPNTSEENKPSDDKQNTSEVSKPNDNKEESKTDTTNSSTVSTNTDKNNSTSVNANKDKNNSSSVNVNSTADKNTATNNSDEIKKQKSAAKKIKAQIKSVKKSGAKAVTVKFKKESGISGYQLQYATNKKYKSSKKVTIKKNKTKIKVSKLNLSSKKYYFRLRTYTDISGTRVYGKWSSTSKFSK